MFFGVYFESVLTQWNKLLCHTENISFVLMLAFKQDSTESSQVLHNLNTKI